MYYRSLISDIFKELARSKDLALYNTQSTLEDIHDGVIEAFFLVDDTVVVDASHDVSWLEIRPVFCYPPGGLLGTIPASNLGLAHFNVDDTAQEFNVARREEVKSAIDIHHTLTG